MSVVRVYGEMGVVRCVWGGECGCGEVGVSVGRWV